MLRVRLPDGTNAIVCGGGAVLAPCGLCSKKHVKLCDFPVGQGTCDAKMCDDHATSVGLDKDYCPNHKGSP